MDGKGDTQYNLNFHSKIYQEVIHIDDVEVIAHFMDKYQQDQEEALAYISQWDYGEISDELLTYSQIMDGLKYVNYVANDLYLALWQTGIECIHLYRAADDENSHNKEVSLKLSECERFILGQGLLALMHNVNAQKSAFYDEEVYKALNAYNEKVKMLINKICQDKDSK